MTKEEFKESIGEFLNDAAEDNSDFKEFVDEGREAARELGEHDAQVGIYINRIVDTMVDLATYIRSRVEP